MLIVEKNPKSVISESFRTLRTNLQYSSLDNQYKVIVITSPNQGEGKTTIASNLALTLAQEESKVVLIDCDLRKPSIHRRFKISNSTGLSDVLLDEEEFVIASNQHEKNMTILTSGHIPPNPAEVLASDKMSKLLDCLRKKFDYIILDTPPLLFVTDPQILSIKADGTILVLRAGKTKKKEVKDSFELLRKVNVNIIGAVLNAVDNNENKYYY
ncbi:CpsD/CapB family tyrosine-protein kinase [Clostridium sp.]|uniref:CpsD/CapB family tyrosine-protein kinase n=1 Tax=Clostridium sp. TaxID=1506 RepID=UPI0025BEF29E|nr:CpsD/CapB family tyrosine-protein kinase [Clostridium sp.]